MESFALVAKYGVPITGGTEVIALLVRMVHQVECEVLKWTGMYSAGYCHGSNQLHRTKGYKTQQLISNKNNEVDRVCVE